MKIFKNKTTEIRQPDSLLTDEQRQAIIDRAVARQRQLGAETLRDFAEVQKEGLDKEIARSATTGGHPPELNDAIARLGETVNAKIDGRVADYEAGKHFGSSDETDPDSEQNTTE